MNDNETASGQDTTALERRLEASRQALCERLHPAGRGAEQAGTERTGAEQTSAARPASWTSLFAEMLLPAVGQFARRHPLALVAGSALGGALLVWTRPWRGVLGSMLLAEAVRKASWIAGSQSAPRLFEYWLNQRKSSAPGRRAAPPAQT